MNAPETTSKRVTETVSTMVFLCGAIVLGLGGFLLLCLMAYAIVTENLALGMVAGLLLFSPYILGFVWFLSMGTSLITERVPRKAGELARAVSRS